MNPYELSSLVNPSIQTDWRVSQKNPSNVGLDYSMSRAFFRLIDSVGRVSLNRQR